jgi:hypothetical protein
MTEMSTTLTKHHTASFRVHQRMTYSAQTRLKKHATKWLPLSSEGTQRLDINHEYGC